ncbi:MAG: MFS transporter [Chloroflexota bacterium]|nr:MFS transporter [Chloroflexota bacterium]
MGSSRPSTSPSAVRADAPPALRRHDASLYIVASALGGLGLGIALFYLNFLYRALGFDARAIGVLGGAQALGGLAGALPAALLPRRMPRRNAIFVGGCVTGLGVVVILTQTALPLLFVGAALSGFGGIIVASSGSALVADATTGLDRPRMFGQQIALSALASFAAIAIAGALAAPVGAALGLGETDPLTIRTVIGIGGVLAIASAIPILFVRPAAVAAGALDPPHRRSLLLRFVAIEMAFGFGAGSFLPFANLFFADRFGLPIAGVGLAIGALSIAGSVGAIVNGRFIVPRLPPLLAIVAPVFASLPFAVLAAVAGQPLLAWAALALRAALMYGSTPNFTALELSSFAPVERAGAVAVFAISWNGASAAGAALSGVVRAELGTAGYTANLATLVASYLVAATLLVVFFRAHEPRGDAAATLPADSVR